MIDKQMIDTDGFNRFIYGFVYMFIYIHPNLG